MLRFAQLECKQHSACCVLRVVWRCMLRAARAVAGSSTARRRAADALRVRRRNAVPVSTLLVSGELSVRETSKNVYERSKLGSTTAQHEIISCHFVVQQRAVASCSHFGMLRAARHRLVHSAAACFHHRQ